MAIYRLIKSRSKLNFSQTIKIHNIIILTKQPISYEISFTILFTTRFLATVDNNSPKKNFPAWNYPLITIVFKKNTSLHIILTEGETNIPHLGDPGIIC